jgi:hypothetical protein
MRDGSIINPTTPVERLKQLKSPQVLSASCPKQHFLAATSLIEIIFLISD